MQFKHIFYTFSIIYLENFSTTPILIIVITTTAKQVM